MVGTFEIGVNTTAEILSNPPPQLRDANVLYTPFAVRVGETHFPTSCWCDFPGLLLLRWCEQVWKLSEYRSRAARLVFWHTYEIWLRRTPKHWWKASCIQRDAKSKRILHEALVIPERVEAALLTAGRRLVAGAKRAGVWTQDCVELARFLDNPEAFLADADPAPDRPDGR